ncbi:putative ABC transport system ATP-binding protein [Granulicatella balaenopterae]|uniref:Putative ABC transport system ATP-binding protein n=1 Tax=Granulicatella balaenopterae TaxID=137733 RepID=A0A1H9KMV7_9LACT|nr:ABC transporter ATP-binding protein [Granulicatella balaenopterae]SER00247.1 putative ABC transport system ATP-binding protein [Granulicatella balaenopterae]
MIELKNINKYYKMGQEDLHVLNNINLSIDEGECVAIMGASGSGKSTLINVMGFLDSKYQGDYLFNQKPITHLTDNEISKVRNQTVGFIFQDFNLIEHATVLENIQLPLLYNGFTPKRALPHVKNALEKVGLADKIYQYPSQLSGGQKQRIAIARALVNKPKFIIADEPTGALDTKNSRSIMEIIEKLNREDGVTIVMVTHDPSLVKYCTRVVRLMDGTIIEDREVTSDEV